MDAATIDEVLQAQQSTVFIVPLVVEDLEFRLSQKTQKKFAVLKASDQSGMLELLAWSDIMETKGPLLKENSLLVALIEIEKKGAEQRTLLKDLYSFESVKIQEVLENRDRLRASQKSFLQKKAQQESRGNVMKGKEEKKEPLLKLQLNEAEMGHQAVVHLKKLFSNSAGKSPVRIRIGPTTLQIDESFGVKITPELLNELKTLKYVEAVEHGEG
jgi:DNA polymerase-3 subunit alpha